MSEQDKTEAEMLAEWESMAGGEEEGAAEAEEASVADAPSQPASAGGVEHVLDQNEIDSLLGIDGDDDQELTGIRALLDQNVVNYEKLPMLDVIFDHFERFLSTSLRHFTADNVDVTYAGMTSVRFGDYLNTVPLPAGLIVVNAIGLEDYILMVYESNLIYSVVDVLLGGRRAAPIPSQGRSFTNIEKRIMDNLTDIVLNDLSEAFAPVAPVQFKMERMEVNPRFAAISQETNVSILVSIRIALEGREGMMHFCLPYATLEPVREQLLQQFMGEKFGQDNIWENHLSQELFHTRMPISAVLDPIKLPLQTALNWKLGDTVVFNARPQTPVSINCGGVTKMVGQMGRAQDFKAFKVLSNITDFNEEQDQK